MVIVMDCEGNRMRVKRVLQYMVGRRLNEWVSCDTAFVSHDTEFLKIQDAFELPMFLEIISLN